ncbi:MAG TPA: YdcF family protein, partial [Chryseosolibacter sp.]
MFFILSKTLSYLVLPLTITVALLFSSRLIKNRKWQKRLLWAGLVLLFIFTNDFISNELMKSWETETRAFSSMRKYQLGIVLTGAVKPELKPDDRVYFQRGADRVVHTVQLYKLGLIDRILVSG